MTEETIFLTALAKATADERRGFLDEACGADRTLRERVEARLRSHQETGGSLRAPATEPGAGRLTPDEAGGCPELTTDEVVVPGKDEALAFLGPPHRPGHLGRLAHYEVLNVIGRGGMGVVLKAFDEKLHRVVAIKVLTPHLAASAAGRQRFLREARSAAAVVHEHVVTIHAVEEADGVPYLVMEHIGGESLQDRLEREGPLPLRTVLRIGVQAAEGLAAAHGRGLVHRDVKPANILLEDGVERVKLTDFGLARAVDDASLSQPGGAAGTPLYMAPEQARGEAVDHRADLFSLGSVLYAMCTGRPPYQANTTLAVLKRVIEDTPRPVRELNPDVPDWLAVVIARLHAKKPEDRYPSARVVAALLRERQAELPSSGRTKPPPTTARPASRRRAWLAVAAATVLVGAGAAVALWLRGQGQGTAGGPPQQQGPASPVVTIPDGVTVAKDERGQFRTLTEALRQARPGSRVLVLDDATYPEAVAISDRARHEGLILESPQRATILVAAPERQALLIDGVPRVRVRGFRLRAAGLLPQRPLVLVKGPAPGVTLEKLDVEAGHDLAGIVLVNLRLGDDLAPVTVRGCSVKGTFDGIVVATTATANDASPRCVQGVVIRDNRVQGAVRGILLDGPAEHVHLVGNAVWGCDRAALQLQDTWAESRNVLVANNTTFESGCCLRVWVNPRRAKLTPGVQVCNNIFFDANLRGVDVGAYLGNKTGGGARTAAFNREVLANWRFSHNWRDLSGGEGEDALPLAPADRRLAAPHLTCREPSSPNFLLLRADSPLLTAGVGGDLPSFVGGRPPAGGADWDWHETWKRRVGKAARDGKD
jgi:hypothetical protein